MIWYLIDRRIVPNLKRNGHALDGEAKNISAAIMSNGIEATPRQ
jgi:hypothetical protein